MSNFIRILRRYILWRGDNLVARLDFSEGDMTDLMAPSATRPMCSESLGATFRNSFCENVQLVPLRRRHVRDVKRALDRRMAGRPPIRGLRLRLYPRLSNVVHLQRACSDEQDRRKLETKNEFLEVALRFTRNSLRLLGSGNAGLVSGRYFSGRRRVGRRGGRIPWSGSGGIGSG